MHCIQVRTENSLFIANGNVNLKCQPKNKTTKIIKEKEKKNRNIEYNTTKTKQANKTKQGQLVSTTY